MSKYLFIINDLRKKIYLFPNEEFKLPSQNKLAHDYKTSRVTIQKVFNHLKKEGLIYTKQGVGTYARKHQNIITPINQFGGLNNYLSDNKHLKSKVISFDMRECTEEEEIKLSLKPTSKVYDIIRLRSFDNIPLVLEYTVMPIDVVPNLSVNILYKSIYAYIEKELKLVRGSISRHIRSDKSDYYDRMFLKLEENEPVLEVEQIAYLNNGTPYEHSFSRWRYDYGEVTYTG